MNTPQTIKQRPFSLENKGYTQELNDSQLGIIIQLTYNQMKKPNNNIIIITKYYSLFIAVIGISLMYSQEKTVSSWNNNQLITYVAFMIALPLIIHTIIASNKILK